jgi:hypothetical protein
MITDTPPCSLSQGLIEAYETHGYTDRVLTSKEFAAMLIDHDYLSTETTDEALNECPNKSLFELLAFLGY